MDRQRYFQRTDRVGAERAERADDAGEVGWGGTWALTLLVLALIGVAVADEMVIAHPLDAATTAFTVLAFGAPGLFLLAQVYFLYAVAREISWPRLAGLVALAAAGVATSDSSRLLGAACAVFVLAAVAAADTTRAPGRAIPV